MTGRAIVVSAVAVYLGRQHVGEIAELDNGQFKALDNEGRSLGTFDSRRDAQRAVLLSSREVVR